MFNKINTKKKLLLFPLLFVIIVTLSAVVYLHFDDKKEFSSGTASQTDVFVEKILKGRISVYQFLRNPSEKSSKNVIDSFKALDNDVLNLKESIENKNNILLCEEIITLSKQYIDNFKKISIILIRDKEESPAFNSIIKEMVKEGKLLETKINEIGEIARNQKSEANYYMDISLISLAISSIIIFIIFSLIISNIILKSLNDFKNGLLSFFDYLNKIKSTTQLLDASAKDEFGEMALFVNENIKQIETTLNQDIALIEDAKNVISRVNNGWYSQLIEKSTENATLEEFKNNVNNMILSTKDRFEIVGIVLEDYTKLDYRKSLELKSTDEKDGVFEKLVMGINSLQKSITKMLIDNKTNGLTLDESSDILLANVDKLNLSSNEAAASLEETAAAVEEITSNIRLNTENITKMATLSDEVINSATSGEKLANETTFAMDEINVQVDLINEAITVIDQIAFQTNILSLNAAVEAATAGEAGKGFAVVAAEVRNLANRSAEAAKEIKQIVENATSKANDGKRISSNMIHGYKKLNESISHTTELISDIQNSSKEQLIGIEQINDAVNSLDQQTQENAMVASQTHDVAAITDKIAKLIVNDANEKEFDGKNEVKAKTTELKKAKDIKIPGNIKKVESKVKHKIQSKVVTSNESSKDEWESF